MRIILVVIFDKVGTKFGTNSGCCGLALNTDLIAASTHALPIGSAVVKFRRSSFTGSQAPQRKHAVKRVVNLTLSSPKVIIPQRVGNRYYSCIGRAAALSREAELHVFLRRGSRFGHERSPIAAMIQWRFECENS